MRRLTLIEACCDPQPAPPNPQPASPRMESAPFMCLSLTVKGTSHHESGGWQHSTGRKQKYNQDISNFDSCTSQYTWSSWWPRTGPAPWHKSTTSKVSIIRILSSDSSISHAPHAARRRHPACLVKPIYWQPASWRPARPHAGEDHESYWWKL